MELEQVFAHSINNDHCAARFILDRIAHKWTILIVGKLAHCTYRFGLLQREIVGISPKILTQKLRELERDGIVQRRVYATVPLRVEYSLTPLGYTLVELLAAISTWVESNSRSILEAQRDFDQREEIHDIGFSP